MLYEVVNMIHEWILIIFIYGCVYKHTLISIVEISIINSLQFYFSTFVGLMGCSLLTYLFNTIEVFIL